MQVNSFRSNPTAGLYSGIKPTNNISDNQDGIGIPTQYFGFKTSPNGEFNYMEVNLGGKRPQVATEESIAAYRAANKNKLNPVILMRIKDEIYMQQHTPDKTFMESFNKRWGSREENLDEISNILKS